MTWVLVLEEWKIYTTTPPLLVGVVTSREDTASTSVPTSLDKDGTSEHRDLYGDHTSKCWRAAQLNIKSQRPILQAPTPTVAIRNLITAVGKSWGVGTLFFPIPFMGFQHMQQRSLQHYIYPHSYTYTYICVCTYMYTSHHVLYIYHTSCL